MACYQTNLTTVEFKVGSLELLEKALKALKWSYSIVGNDVCITSAGINLDLENETASFDPRRQEFVNRLKQQYSHEVVKQVAKKKRWALSKKSETKYIARRY